MTGLRKRPGWHNCLPRKARRAAAAVIREQIQCDLSAGKTDDEARFHARRIRDRFLLPVPDMRLEHILWREVAIHRGGLV